MKWKEHVQRVLNTFGYKITRFSHDNSDVIGEDTLIKLGNLLTELMGNIKTEQIGVQKELSELIAKCEAMCEIVSAHTGKELTIIPVPDNSDDFEQFMRRLTAVHIETTNYCEYHCVFCPHDLMTRPKGVQSLNDFEWILRNIFSYNTVFNGNFRLQSMGEPLLDKELPVKVAKVRQYFPNAMILINSTVGVMTSQNMFEELIESGLDYIRVSCYGVDRETYIKAHGIDRFSLVMENLKILSTLVEKKQGRFRIIIQGPYEITNETKHEEFKNMMLKYGFEYENVILHNFGGWMSLNPLRRATRPCSIYKGAFSRTLQIDWDLKIIPCCVVMNQEVVFGDLREKSLREIYYDKPWSDFRESHKKMTTQKHYPYCWKCNMDANEWTRAVE